MNRIEIQKRYKGDSKRVKGEGGRSVARSQREKGKRFVLCKCKELRYKRDIREI